MATRIRQTPKVTKKSPAKARSIGGGAKKVQHVTGLHAQEKKTASPAKPRGRQTTSSTNKMPAIVEYPGERKGRGFGKDVKVVGQRG